MKGLLHPTLATLLLLTTSAVVPAAAHGREARLTGQILVRQDGRGAVDPTLLRRIEQHPATARVEHAEGSWPALVVDVTPGVDPLAFAAEIDRWPTVAWAFADRLYTVVPTGAGDPLLPEQWHLTNTGANAGALPGADVDAERAWEIAGSGAGIRIAVLDSGVDMDHPDLLVDTTVAWDAVDNDGDANPSTDDGGGGHGTCVAGLAAAIGDNGIGVRGVAWGATILPYRMIGDISANAMRSAFLRAVDAGADVINNSWGFAGGGCPELPEIPPLSDALDYAESEGRGGLGTVVLFATGNDGCRQPQDPLAGAPTVIGVGAATDRDTKWPYSTWGPATDVLAPSGSLGGRERPDLWTTDIVGDIGWNGAGAENEYTPWFGGTSGATPVASGVVALMIAANPRADAASIRSLVCETATKVDAEAALYDAAGWSDSHGCGRIDAGAAVAAIHSVPPEAPALTSPGAEAVPLASAVLRWTGPEDGRWLRYRVEFAPAAGGESTVYDDIDGTVLDVRADLGPGEWQVSITPHDRWGEGAVGGPFPLRILDEEPTEDDGAGCSLGGERGAGIAALLLLVGAFRKRPRTPTPSQGLGRQAQSGRRIAAAGAAVRPLLGLTLLVATSCVVADPMSEPTPDPQWCGDTRVSAAEECDDGNPWSGDGCGADCLFEARPGENEPNDDPAAPGNLDGSGGVIGALVEGDRDCYRVVAADGGWIGATLAPAGGGVCEQARIELVDPLGNLVATSTPDDAGCAVLDPATLPGARFLAPGTHALCVSALLDDAVRGYTLQAEGGADSCALPWVFPSDADIDLDAMPDPCDDDDDGDGVGDDVDLCPHTPDGGHPVLLSPDGEGFLRDWLFAGPFAHEPTTEACRASDTNLLGDDATHEPELAAPAGTLSWALYRSPNSRVDVLATMGGDVPREVYAALYVRAPAEGTVTLALGPDDGIRVWIDEDVLLDVASCQGTNIDQFQAELTLGTDWRRLLLKVRDQGGGWGFYARFLDEGGQAVTDLEISLAPDGLWSPGQTDTDEDGVGDTCDF